MPVFITRRLCCVVYHITPEKFCQISVESDAFACEVSLLEKYDIFRGSIIIVSPFLC